MQKRFLTKILISIEFCSLLVLPNVGQSKALCTDNVVQSTIYFIPHIKDYCKGTSPCEKFKKEVKLQGSGKLSDNQILTYKGKKIDLGSCNTAFGASGKCLLPYLSVAGDARHYRMGDIIEIPSMRGKTVKLENGNTMIHPGYFIVHDTGGAIKGATRFDFFTGSFGLYNSNNSFGIRGTADQKMYVKKGCEDYKKFSVVRRDDPTYNEKLLAIEQAVTARNPSTTPSNGKGIK